MTNRLSITSKDTCISPKATGILFSLLFMVNFCYAQGYIGKRLLVGFEVSSNLWFNETGGNYTYKQPNEAGELQNIDLELDKMYFTFKPTLTLEYVLSRKSTIQVLARYYSNEIDVVGFTHNDSIYHPNSRSKATTISIGLKHRIWLKNGLSPIGKYFSLGLEYTSSTIEVGSNQFYADYSESAIPSPNKLNSVIPTIGFGTQYPINSKLIFNLGLEFGIPFITSPEYPANGYYYTPVSMDQWAGTAGRKNVWRANLICLNLGLYLAP